MKILGEQRYTIDDGKHLTVERHSVLYEHPLHWHSHFEMEIIMSGAGKYVINDIEYDLGEYNVFFLTSTDFHYLTLESEATLINISFDEEAVSEEDIIRLLFMKTEKAYSFTEEEHARLVSAAELLMYECENGGGAETELLQYIFKFLLRKSKSAAMHTDVGYESYKGIKRAIVYMQMHFKEDISLSEIAREAGYHPTYFSELYKRVTGESFSDAILRLRLGYARTMLKNGFSVADSCFLSGFGSLSNFTAVFKRQCGVTPSEYKIMQRTHSDNAERNGIIKRSTERYNQT